MEKIIDLNNLDKNETVILNKIYLKNKKLFINELGDFLEDNNKFSFFHPLLCKLNDNYLLYKEFCYFKLCKILLFKNKSKKIKILTRSLTEYYFLKKNLKNNAIIYLEKNKFFLNLLFYPKIIFRFLNIFFFILFEIIHKNNNRFKVASLKKNINLYENPLLNSMFKNKKFKNRFFLNQFINNDIMFVTNLTFFNTKKNFKILHENKINFITYGDILTYKDFFYAFGLSLKNNIKKKKSFNKQKINIEDLIKHDLFISRGNFNYFIGILNYFFFKRIKNKLDIKKVINWNENRPSDKGLILSCREFFHDSEIIAKRNFFIDYKYNFQYQITKFDFKYNLHPSNVLMIDHNSIELASELEKRVRYVKDFDTSRFNFSKRKIVSKSLIDSALVILPIIKREAEFILKCIYEISTNSNFKKFNFYIKPHPSYENSYFIRLFKIKIRLKKINIFFSNNYLDDEKFSYVIGNATSGLVEYFNKSKKILIIKNSENFIDNPISNNDENIKICHDLNDLILSLKSFNTN